MSARLRIAAVLATGLLLLGSGCGPPAVELAGVYAEVDNSFVFANGSYFVKVNLVVTSKQPFQAYELELTWNPEVVQLVEQGNVGLPRPHAQFDDDGTLFAPVVVDQQAGRASNVVDLRHGGAGLSGEVRVASAWFWAPAGGQATISVSGEIATPGGERFAVLVANPLRFE